MALPSPFPACQAVLLVDPAGGGPDPISPRIEALGSNVEVIRCRTAEEAWCALAAGRRYSAVVATSTDAADSALRAAALRSATPLISASHPGSAMQLRVALAAGGTSRREAVSRRGRLLAVCGTGGVGTSSVAAGLAAALAEMPTPDAPRPNASRVLLADLALRSDQAFLHGVGEAPGGLVEMVDIARCRPLTRGDARNHTVALGRCRMLPGFRHPSHWTALGTPAFDAALGSLLRMFDLVVADITGDFEGEAESGSLDVEERNHPARRSTAIADVVVAVGRPGGNGRRRLSQLVDDLLDHGVDPARIQPVVVDQAPSPGPVPLAARVSGLPAPPVRVAAAGEFRDRPLSPQEVEPVVHEALRLLRRAARLDEECCSPVRIGPGSLGCAV